MRVGALPQFPTNALKYNLTWSTDGLINEYCNPCEAIHEGRRIDVLPLEGLEHFSLDGVRYEAFNTSGGLGTLCETLDGRVRELNYRTIRYLGHRDLMAFLVNELRLSRAARTAEGDSGKRRARHVPGRGGDLLHRHRLAQAGSSCRSATPGRSTSRRSTASIWSAIQITTAAGLCAACSICTWPAGCRGRASCGRSRSRCDDFSRTASAAHYRDTVVDRYSRARIEAAYPDTRRERPTEAR